MSKALAAVFAFWGVLAFGAENVIWDNQPGRGWENSWYPLGNGRLGCMVDGGAENLRLQFNVDSLWTGDKNLTKDIHDNRADANYSTMGAYQNFGELNIAIEGLGEGAVTDYRRQLNVSTAVYDDQFKIADDNFKRRIFASAPDDAIFIFISDVKKRGIRLTLKGAHGEGEKSDNNSVSFSGTLPNVCCLSRT